MKRLDLSLPVLLPLGVALVVCAQWLEGGSVWGLVQGTAALIVVGGTAGAVLVSFPFDDLQTAGAAFARLFRRDDQRVQEAIARVVRYATTGRRKGLLALESDAAEEPDEVLRRGLTLAVDGVPGLAVRGILERETETRLERDERAAQVFESAGGYSPTLGILGAVLGLIHVMENLSDPSKLGEGIAVAFVATVYGVGLANLALLPIATRLRQRAAREARWRDVMTEAVMGIHEGLNPRVLGQRLAALVPPDEQPAEQEDERAA